MVASGVAAAHAWDLLEDLGVLGKIDFYQVIMPYPLHQDFREKMRSHYDRVLVLEETYPVVELQLSGAAVQGRETKTVPREGELTPEVMRPFWQNFLSCQRTPRPRRERVAAPRPPYAPVRPPVGVLCHPGGLSRGHFPQRHRLLHPGDEPGGGGHLPLHGRGDQPGRRLLPG